MTTSILDFSTDKQKLWMRAVEEQNLRSFTNAVKGQTTIQPEFVLLPSVLLDDHALCKDCLHNPHMSKLL
jgi:hypothetical protein